MIERIDDVDDEHLQRLVVTDHVVVIELTSARHDFDAKAMAVREAAFFRVLAQPVPVLDLKRLGDPEKTHSHSPAASEEVQM